MNAILGLIPARGGSKTLPNKNITPLLGKSLIQRAWECARESGVLDRVILSTDDPMVAQCGKAAGLDVPFMRPAAFARDDSPMIDVVVHALETLREQEGYVPHAVLLLQPTSPLRTPDHICRAVSLLPPHDAVCSVVPVPMDLAPHYLMKRREDGYLEFFMPDGFRYTRRQDVPVAYRRDGTIFLTRTDVLLQQRSFYGGKCLPMLMSPEEVLNIDTAEDWAEAERVLNARLS